jgi:hypothetical protein
MHHDISRSPTIAFQVTTFLDVAGDAPSHTYRFLLDAPIAVPSYFTGLHASTLPTSWSSWRSSSPTIPLTQTSWARRAQTHTTSFTQHMLNVQHTAFLFHITAHRSASNCSIQPSHCHFGL